MQEVLQARFPGAHTPACHAVPDPRHRFPITAGRQEVPHTAGLQAAHRGRQDITAAPQHLHTTEAHITAPGAVHTAGHRPTTAAEAVHSAEAAPHRATTGHPGSPEVHAAEAGQYHAGGSAAVRLSINDKGQNEKDNIDIFAGVCRRLRRGTDHPGCVEIQ